MFEVKAISIVRIQESSVIHLMAVTASGIRLYFSTIPKRFRVTSSNFLKKRK